MRKLGPTLLAVVVLAGCSSGHPKYDACVKQADRLADTQGVDAGSAKLHQCVDNRANGVY